MNWNLVWWFVGVCGTLTALKFVIVLFKSLFSKDSMKLAIGALGDKISDANEVISEKIKAKAEEKKKKKEEEKHKGEAYVMIR